jgi:hypothetical protein
MVRDKDQLKESVTRMIDALNAQNVLAQSPAVIEDEIASVLKRLMQASKN